MFDLVLRNGTIVTPSWRKKADVGVFEGKISIIGNLNEISNFNVKKIIDISGLFILPGIIDSHVHFRDPGFTEREDFITGSTAAAFGGVTTVLDMPNTTPRIFSSQNYKLKEAAIKNRSYVDYAFWGYVLPGYFEEIENLAEAGIVGFKVMMCESASKTPILNDGELLEAMWIVSKTGLPLAVHAENDQMMKHMRDKLIKAGRTDPEAHLESRPIICEKEAVQRAILYAEETLCKLYIAHTSSAEAVNLVRKAKFRGVQVFCETGPQYLLLEEEDMSRAGYILKTNPPVRCSKINSDKMWEGIVDGTIEIIGTDHAPHLLENKMRRNVWEVPSGFPGVETSVPLMLTQVNDGKITLEKFVEITSQNPARIFGLYPRKGCISPGSDADFTVVDLDAEGFIKASELHSKNKYTPFDGSQVKARIIYTIVRGNIVVEKGKLIGEPQGILCKRV